MQGTRTGRAASRDFPLDAAGTKALFADLGERLAALYQAELAALDVLKQAL